ncbi:hypothetical protein AVEN_272640-1 [Araneus ventricosus]|uniref:Uncharacterized protein n=1 Tax=Araneus ventricosus TaxID=182803 RepID=A0A4Y2C411_ARAVE|nr:hypothetical protein AVEN_272640-1 [Araneus ventricosus]
MTPALSLPILVLLQRTITKRKNASWNNKSKPPRKRGEAMVPGQWMYPTSLAASRSYSSPLANRRQRGGNLLTMEQPVGCGKRSEIKGKK